MPYDKYFVKLVKLDLLYVMTFFQMMPNLGKWVQRKNSLFFTSSKIVTYSEFAFGVGHMFDFA